LCWFFIGVPFVQFFRDLLKFRKKGFHPSNIVLREEKMRRVILGQPLLMP
jgi:hypothetical protein